MGFLSFLNNWWNFPFLVMLALVALFLVLQLVGIIGDAGDHDHDVDHDHDLDGGSAWDGVLGFFGVGRVPFMVVWVTFFIFAGFSGLFLNRVWFVNHGGAYAGWFFAVALLAATVVGLAGVRLFSRLAARFVDTGGKGASAKQELCGKIGIVASTRVDQGFGEVRITDARGHEMIVHARLAKGEAAVSRGTRVVLVEYDDKKDLFWATVSPTEPVEAEAQV